MKIPAELLRDYIVSEVNRLAAKFPNLATALQTLKERSLPRLADENMDFAAVEDALEAIVKDADELDTDGYVLAIAQQLTGQLDAMSRSALAAGVPVFPSLCVTLSLAQPETGAQAETVPEPGFRSRLGGKPQWIQSDATPICERCQRAMTFVAQVDSIANQHTALGRLMTDEKSFMFADVGMLYLFWCSGCNKTWSVLQCG